MLGFKFTATVKATSLFLCLVSLTSFTGYGAEARGQDPSKELLGSAGGIAHFTAASESMKDGGFVIDKWLKASESYPSYSFSYKMTVYKPGGPVTEVGTVAFKKPRLLKIEETGGPKRGSVAILQANGKVKAHGGGGLKFFSVDLSPDSNYLKSTNGWPMVKSDFTSLAEAVKGYIANGDTPKASEPMTAPGKGEKVILFELYKGTTIFKRAHFDPNTFLPLEWWDYLDGKLWAHSVWTNFQAVELPEGTFTMKGVKDKGDK